MTKKDINQQMDIMEKVLTGKKEEAIMTLTYEQGSITLYVYSIAPGIALALNDVHASTVPIPRFTAPLDHNFFIMNYCLDGRCEFKFDNDRYGYIEKEMTSIGIEMAQDEFYYPTGYYLGFEIYAFPQMMDEEAKKVLKWFSIDFQDLKENYQTSVYIATPEIIAHRWNDLYMQIDHCTIGNVRLTVMEILNYFSNHILNASSDAFYLTKTQTLLAKKAHEILTDDLARHISMKMIADQLHVSESSLKNYFRYVYGTNVSEYMNEKRIQHASYLLAHTEESIYDVAKACGFSNQGRFAKTFKERFGMKPLDYRRNQRIQEK